MRRLLSLVAVCLVAIPLFADAPAPVMPAPSAPPDVHVISCQVVSGAMLPKPDEIGLAVRFANQGTQPLRSIVWRADFEDQPIDFIDDGTFAPKLRIDNYVLFETGASRTDWWGVVGDIMALAFRAPPAYATTKTAIVLPPFAGTQDPENCTLVRATTQDGTVWLNPEIPQEPAIFAIPSPPPGLRATPPPAAYTPIALLPCALMLNKKSEALIIFRNDSHRTADSIVFRAPYDYSALDFTDQGVFAPGVVVRHVLKRDTPELGDRGFASTERCSVVRVHYRDGTQWTNPAIPATPAPLPTPVPGAIVLSAVKGPHWVSRHALATPLPLDDPPASPSPSPS